MLDLTHLFHDKHDDNKISKKNYLAINGLTYKKQANRGHFMHLLQITSFTRELLCPFYTLKTRDKHGEIQKRTIIQKHLTKGTKEAEK